MRSGLSSTRPTWWACPSGAWAASRLLASVVPGAEAAGCTTPASWELAAQPSHGATQTCTRSIASAALHPAAGSAGMQAAALDAWRSRSLARPQGLNPWSAWPRLPHIHGSRAIGTTGAAQSELQDSRGRAAPPVPPADDPLPSRRHYRRQAQFQVTEFLKDTTGGGVKLVERSEPRSAEQLGLHPRDVSLFDAGDSGALGRAIPQRATITARNNAIYFKTEAVGAIITADKAIVIKSR